MTSFSDHVNGSSPTLFGDLTTTHEARHLSELTPVMATPATLGKQATPASFSIGSVGSKQPY